jgi:hypothetical protein
MPKVGATGQIACAIGTFFLRIEWPSGFPETRAERVVRGGLFWSPFVADLATSFALPKPDGYRAKLNLLPNFTGIGCPNDASIVVAISHDMKA